jgi:hypothetical protein
MGLYAKVGSPYPTATYLGYQITKGIDTKGKTIYTTRTAVVPKKTVTEAKKDIIAHLAKGKVSVLKLSSVKSKVGSIKTVTDLNNLITKTNSMAVTKKAAKPRKTAKRKPTAKTLGKRVTVLKRKLKTATVKLRKVRTVAKKRKPAKKKAVAKKAAPKKKAPAKKRTPKKQLSLFS